jgi:hypothetical protein
MHPRFRIITLLYEVMADATSFSDAWTKREQANETKFIREREMERYSLMPSIGEIVRVFSKTNHVTL